MKLKAYKISDNYCDYSVIIFAETRNKARLLGRGLPELEYADYIDIKAIREPEADKYAEEPGVFPFCLNADKFKEMGWGCTGANACGVTKCVLNEEAE